MKRILALMLALMLMLMLMLMPTALAENMDEAAYSSEEIHAVVESLFAAVTGASYDAERALREDMSDEELLERNGENAEYRAMTLPWLEAVFAPEDMPEPEPSPEPAAGPEIAWTVDDSWNAFHGNEYGSEYIELLAGYGAADMESCIEFTREMCGLWLAEVDHARLLEMNGDYVMWIYAPATQIDYPVVQCGDNSTYLKRMFNGEKNSAGTLFIDYRNLADLRDPNTLIYGHHMRNDSMFGALTDYGEQAYYEAHPYMLILHGGAVYLAEIFAGYTTSDSDHCYDIAISDADDMLEFVETARDKSDFISAVEILPVDRLVTLSTCAYAFEDARYIAIARLKCLRDRPESIAAE